MKKILLLAVFTILLVLPSFAGTIDISGRAGIFTPTQAGASPSLMYGVGAECSITPNLSARAAVETTTYSANNVQYTYTPITLDLIYHQTFAGILIPYFGAGVSYNSRSVGGVSSQTTGVQAEAGLKFVLGGFSSGAEIRYMVPDINNMNSGSTTYNGYATGSFAQSFHF